MDHLSALYVLWPSCYVPQISFDIGSSDPDPKPAPFASGIERGHLIELLRRLGSSDALHCADHLAAGARFRLDPASSTTAGRIDVPTRAASRSAGRAARRRRRDLMRLRRLGAEPIVTVDVRPVPSDAGERPARYTVLVAGLPDRAIHCCASSAGEDVLQLHG